MAGGGKPRVIGVSLKDRAAILPSGHMADGAFWFDVKTGNFVSSTFYYKELPGWVQEFNAPRPADKYRGVTWLGHKMPEDNAKLFTTLESTPFGNELIEAFAERALAAEQLGTRESTDVLTVSFSSNDYVGHSYGPDSPEVHDDGAGYRPPAGEALPGGGAAGGRGQLPGGVHRRSWGVAGAGSERGAQDAGRAHRSGGDQGGGAGRPGEEVRCRASGWPATGTWRCI